MNLKVAHIWILHKIGKGLRGEIGQTYCLNGRRLQISGQGEHFLGSFSEKPKGESDDRDDDDGGGEVA